MVSCQVNNEGRGYVLRRIIRRAARHGRLLGIEGKFLAELSKTVIEGSKDGYPELEEKKDFIYNVIIQEEGKFNKTIDQGLAILADLEESMKEKGVKELDGEDAFKLYDTYGFPLDLTKEIKEDVVDDELAAYVEDMITQRKEAKKAKDFAKADAIRDELLAKGIELKDTREGTVWSVK